ncbi:MAG: OmpH family outer membrane protein [Kiritimatiellae bacterium]|nr:OmpH family outer membrane protein [Kiritimatiellia bacterium]
MKKSFAFVALLFFLAVGASAESWKIAAVDLEKVFAAHPKTAAAEAELKAQEAVAEEELAKLADDLRTRKAELDQAREAARSPLLSEEAKAAKRAAIDELETALAETQLRARKTQESRLRQLQEQVLKTRQSIVDEMDDALERFAKANGYALLLDKSGLTMNHVPAVAYVRPSLDVTDALIAFIQNDSTATEP